MKPPLLLGIVGVAFIGIFGYHRINAYQQEQVRLIRTQTAQEHADQQAQSEAAALLNQVEQYRKGLPPDADPSWLVNQLTPLAQKVGIQLTTISPESHADQKSFTRLSATLQFSASYHQLGSFLDAVENAPMFLRIDRVEITPEAEGQEKAPMRVSISTVYLPVLQQPVPAGKPAAK